MREKGFGAGAGAGQENAGSGRRPRAPSVVVRKAPKKAPAVVVRKAEKAKKAPAPKRAPKKAAKAAKPRGRPRKTAPAAAPAETEEDAAGPEEDDATEGSPLPAPAPARAAAPAKRPAAAAAPAAPPAKRPGSASGGGGAWGAGGGGSGVAELRAPPAYRDDAPYRSTRAFAAEVAPAAVGVRGGGASESQGFYQLRASYRELEQKYKDLKVAKIAQVKALLEEQSENLAQQGEASKKLVDVWRAEAERQAGVVRELTAAQAQSAGVDAEAHRALEAEAAQLREEAQRAAGGLGYLLGLRAEALPQGGFQYRHPGTGFTFQVVPASSVFDDDDDGFAEGDVAYVPVQLGTMCDSLPDFLREEIAIEKHQRGKLISNLLKHLPC